jgi:Raf kinase inhibitor-like YbhB/YbcL family protein
MALTLRSPAFAQNQKIPTQFSKDGGNHSPPIEWQGAPAGTRSFALIVEDPDAPMGIFRHWAAYDIAADAQRLAEGAGSRVQGAAMRMGRNDFGNAHYDGPQPPPGHGTHHYHFRLFALDVPQLEVDANSAADEVLAAAEEHALAEADVVGTFERKEMRGSGIGQEAQGIEPDIADADKQVRTGSAKEEVRSTPPAGDYNDDA